MLNVFTLANGRLFQEEIESHAALAACAAGLGRSRRAHRGRKGLDRRALRPHDPERRGRRRPRGVGPLLRGRQRRAAHPLRLPDRRRRDAAQRPRRLHPVPQHPVLGARRGPAGVPPAAPARAAHPGADRGRQGRAAQALRRRRRVLGRRARGHLRPPRGGERARAAAGRQRPGRRRGALGDRPRGRPERPHPPQRDGHAARGQLHDAQPHAQRRAVRGGAADPARHRLARQPHRPSCSTRSTS